MKQSRHKLTLDRPVLYQIKVPGRLDESWVEWDGGLTAAVECEGDNLSITTISGTIDQAALQGLLRRLYAVGLPLLSVICVDCSLEEDL